MKELWKWDLGWIVKIYSTKFWFLSPDLWGLCSLHLKASGNLVVFSTLRGRRLTHMSEALDMLNSGNRSFRVAGKWLWKFESPRFDDVFVSKPDFFAKNRGENISKTFVSDRRHLNESRERDPRMLSIVRHSSIDRLSARPIQRHTANGNEK